MNAGPFAPLIAEFNQTWATRAPELAVQLKGDELFVDDSHPICGELHSLCAGRYLGLLTQENALTPMGLTVCDLMCSLGFKQANQVSMRRRLSTESPGLAAVTRLVLMQQESTKLITDTLRRIGNKQLNTEQLLRGAASVLID